MQSPLLPDKGSTTPHTRFKTFIRERHRIYLRRQAGHPAPWTDDPILSNYRFCNIYRQLDKVTKWLNTNWYPCVQDEHLIFMACVARLFNHPEPLTAMAPTLRHGALFRPEVLKEALRAVKKRGGTVRGPAYIVSTNGRALPFEEYIVDQVLIPLRRARLVWNHNYDTLEQLSERLQHFQGFGSFMAGQVIADLKYVHSEMTPEHALDWWSYVVPGPGSKRGLNRLHGRPHDMNMTDLRFKTDLVLAQDLADTVCLAEGWSIMHAQDVQNCLCEFDKYERALHNQGRPKQRYVPG